MAYGLASRRRARFGIPRVNQNPKPPGVASNRLANRANSPGNGKIGVGQAHSVSGDRDRTLPGKPPPQLQSQSTNAGAGSTALDPRDDQYWRDYAQINFTQSQGLSGLNTQDIYSRTAYEQALQRRSFDEPVEVQRERENANVGGTIYSTAHQEDLGRLAQSQFQTRRDLETDFNQGAADRALQRQGLTGQAQIDLANALAASVGRVSQVEGSRPGPVVDPNDPAAPYGTNNNKVQLAAKVKALQAKAKKTQNDKLRQALFARIKKLNAQRRH